MAAQRMSGPEIAAVALDYAGLPYAWGGSASLPGNWDCSSFVSYVLGHDFGLALPGGRTYGDAGYPPHSHGPDVAAYLAWDGAVTLGRKETPQPGDLCIWGPNGHIGIATGPTTMVSALDTSLGTVATPITGYGPSGSALVFRRVRGVGATPTGAGGLPGEIASGISGLVGKLTDKVLGPVAGPVLAGLLLGEGLGIGLIVIGAGAFIIVTGSAAGLLALAAAARKVAS